jgi:hypothetical protein
MSACIGTSWMTGKDLPFIFQYAHRKPKPGAVVLKIVPKSSLLKDYRHHP